MLILTRKTDEEIIIDSEIKIKILSISENQIKIGISAPENIRIFRAEVYERIKNFNIQASSNIDKRVNVSNLKINVKNPGSKISE